MILTQSIPEQLTEIYFNNEDWHVFKLSYESALCYHTDGLAAGNIHTYEENGEVLGYYERHFVLNVCFLDNVFIKEGHRKGRVFRELCRHFFSTLPENIIQIIGEKQKLKGKVVRANIGRIRNGKH